MSKAGTPRKGVPPGSLRSTLLKSSNPGVALVAGELPVKRENSVMESIKLLNVNLEDEHIHVTPSFRYRRAKAMNAPPEFRFEIASIVLVSGGVRFWRDGLPAEPSTDEILHATLREGAFCPRPYLFGQDRDECSKTSVFALLDHYCEESRLDFTDLIIKASHPYEIIKGDWTPERWKRIRDDAEWQRLVYPKRWTPADVLGLQLSLQCHGMQRLNESLLTAIGSARRRIRR